MGKILHLLSLMLFICSCNDRQQTKSSEDELLAAIDLLMKGIKDSDENILKSITADELVYGHSNGKVQNKDEFIEEIISGQPLIYESIELTGQTIKIVSETAIVRHVFAAETLSNGIRGHLKIGNMLIWKRQQGRWKLLARQAYR